MITLQQQIAEKFVRQLTESKEVAPERIEKLKAALFSQKKPKVEDLVKIFAEADAGDLK